MRTGRKNDEMREVRVTKNYIMHPEGSVLIEFGNTKVICNATVEEKFHPSERKWNGLDNCRIQYAYQGQQIIVFRGKLQKERLPEGRWKYSV